MTKRLYPTEDEIIATYKAQLSLIKSVSAKISGNFDVDDICRIALKELLVQLGYRVSGITLMSKDEKTFRVVRVQMPYKFQNFLEKFSQKALAGLVLDVNHPTLLSARALREGKLFTTTRLSDILFPIVSKRNCDVLQAMFRYKLFIALPIKLGKKVIGGLALVANDEFMFDRDVDVLEAVANAVGGAIYSARMHAELQSQFFAEASHELKNPLTAIKGNAELLQMTDKNQKNDVNIRSIMNSADNLHAVIRRFGQRTLSGHNVESGEKTVVDLNFLVAKELDSLRPLFVQKHLSVVSDLKAKKRIFCDQMRVVEVIDNVLINAIKYTPQRGAVRVVAFDDAHMSCVSVQDTGVGIDASDLDRIFQKFYRSHQDVVQREEGDGIGLFVAKQIMDAHKGEITVQSKRGIGSEFVLKFPIYEDEKLYSL